MLTDAARAFLFDLLDTPSPSGFEAAGQRVWTDYVRPFADAVETDTYGTAWATLRGTGGDAAPRVMLEAHADEIGFMVNHVTDDGFLHVVRIGGSDRALARGHRVRLLGDQGVVKGILGHTAIHLRDPKEEKVPEWHDLYIDIGADSREAVLARGLRVGHPAVLDQGAEELTEGRLFGRALDNRIGGFIMAQVTARLAEDRPHATVLTVNAVQEEIGGHGARMVATRLQPDLAVVLDVTHATDVPGISQPRHGRVEMGKGPTLTHGTANHPRVVAALMAAAEATGVPVQHEASSRFTGTDTDSIFNAGTGIASALVSLPMRYMHSAVEMVDLADVEACVDLLTTFVRTLREW